MIKYYSPIVDAMLYISNVIDDVSIKEIHNELCENHSDIANEITALLEPALKLEEILNSSVKLESTGYDFYFRRDIFGKEGKTDVSSVAAIILSFLDVSVDHCRELEQIRKARLSLSKRERMSLIISNSIINQYDGNGEISAYVEAEDDGALINFISNLNAPIYVKRKLISTYVNFDEHVNELIELLYPVVDVLKANEQIYEGAVRRTAQSLDGIEDIRQYIMENYGLLLGGSSVGYSIHIDMFNPNSITVHENGNGAPDIYIGVCLKDITDLFYAGCDSNKLASRFKVLSDETRLNILRCICNRPCYGVELAEIFSISAPTVSYHMNKLVLNGFVESSLESGKMYYKARIDNIDAFNEMFKRFLNSPTPSFDE